MERTYVRTYVHCTRVLEKQKLRMSKKQIEHIHYTLKCPCMANSQAQQEKGVCLCLSPKAKTQRKSSSLALPTAPVWAADWDEGPNTAGSHPRTLSTFEARSMIRTRRRCAVATRKQHQLQAHRFLYSRRGRDYLIQTRSSSLCASSAHTQVPSTRCAPLPSLVCALGPAYSARALGLTLPRNVAPAAPPSGRHPAQYRILLLPTALVAESVFGGEIPRQKPSADEF